MGDKEKEKASDFRYATGPATVPWAAIGENVNVEDLMKIVGFLIGPGEDEADYDEALEQVREALEGLREEGTATTKLAMGEKVQELEEEVKEFLGCKYACFVTNATAGFEIGYQFAGLRPGDEVIAPAITFISSVSYPLVIGAKVVFADLDPRTLLMDPDDVARKVTDRTKVIIPVHVSGYSVDMDPIMQIAKEHDLVVIEDAAHSFGGEYKGRKSGTIGHFGSFSFHEVKNITSLGEGGVLVTNTDWGEHFNPARFASINMAQQIPNWLYDVTALPSKAGPQAAGNHSATEIQAVCLLGQMERLAEIIHIRRERAEYLHEQFEPVEGLVPAPLDTDEIKSTYHLYLLQVEPDKLGGDIQEFKQRLTDKGVTNIPHYAPLSKFSLLRDLGYDPDAAARSCPVAENAFNHTFTHLPLYPLEDAQVELMAKLVIEAAEEMKADN